MRFRLGTPLVSESESKLSEIAIYDMDIQNMSYLLRPISTPRVIDNRPHILINTHSISRFSAFIHQKPKPNEN